MSLLSNFQTKQNKIETANNIANAIITCAKYTKLNYIQSTGAQYIDTGFTPNSNTTIELSYQLVSTSNEQGLLSAYTTWTDNSFLLYTYSGVNWTYGSKRYAAPADTNKHILNIYRGRIIRDGTTISDVTSGTYSNINTTIHLFCGFNNGSKSKYANYRLFYCKIWDNGTLIRDFIPVLDINNVPCLYDRLYGKFYYNGSSTQFSYSM